MRHSTYPPTRRQTFAASLIEAPSLITGGSAWNVPSLRLTLNTPRSADAPGVRRPQLFSSAEMPTPNPGTLAFASAMIDSPSGGSVPLSTPGLSTLPSMPMPKPTSKHTAVPSSVWQIVAPPPTPS